MKKFFVDALQNHDHNGESKIYSDGDGSAMLVYKISDIGSKYNEDSAEREEQAAQLKSASDDGGSKNHRK